MITDQVHPNPEGLHFQWSTLLAQHGTVMGTHMAPSDANLLMGELEQVLLQTQHRAPLVWWRCVDDILAIWTHGEAALQEVLASLNQHHTTIKYQLSKHLARVLSPLVCNSPSHMQNSLSFANLIHSQVLQDDEILAAFDVVSLFTNVPVELAVLVA